MMSPLAAAMLDQADRHHAIRLPLEEQRRVLVAAYAELTSAMQDRITDLERRIADERSAELDARVHARSVVAGERVWRSA